MAAVSCVALTKVVVRAFPLKLTVEPLTKFVPFTVKVKAAPPAMALVGEMLVMVGTNEPSPTDRRKTVPKQFGAELQAPPAIVVP